MDQGASGPMCCNGLILGGKVGAYCQAGIYTTLIGALQSSIEKYREALVSFENQLKHKETPRRVLVRTYSSTKGSRYAAIALIATSRCWCDHCADGRGFGQCMRCPSVAG